MMNEVFLDTTFAVALGTPADEFHARAMRIASQVERARRRLVTTDAVILEIGNALSRPPNRNYAINMISQLRVDPDALIIPLSDSLLSTALEMFERFDDKTWGLVDCISFVVMRERGITDALTADRHFQQAGFRALLLEGDLE